MLVVACMDVGTRAMQEHIAGPSFFKGVAINAKMRLDHELLSSPEPHILKWLGYIPRSTPKVNAFTDLPSSIDMINCDNTIADKLKRAKAVIIV
ncbi:hypothetical protein [Pseudoalteromonas sp. NBT06-2]|uniref:hypothetical protein n=1 Tax=Pseudoalteromonas sp. NBT06-2 TaxID=2025950 RepID=UPI00148310DF|nr:hypothetical protein [Pseudoalteromonas sp. NBT06-2]